jgi:NADPH:quinone reductase-like Zn-dependent oxidoreductase
MFEDLNRYVAAVRIRPAVGRAFSFDEARAAFDYLESGSHFGKVVIKVRH